MPLFNVDQPIKPITPTPGPITEVPIINTVAEYANLQFHGNLIVGLDGTPWTGTYYAQFLGGDDVVINSNDVNDPTLKQYLKIYGFELRVTAELTSNLNTGTGTSVVTGSANVYPVITPQSGDLFVATIQDGVLGIFEVTTIERSSQFKQSVWVIGYSQIGYGTPGHIAEIEHFVVDELVFDVTKLELGANPLHTKSEYTRTLTKEQLVLDLIDSYYSEFFNNLTQTFILPESVGVGIYYDPWLIDFWNTFINEQQCTDIKLPISYEHKLSYCNHPFITIYDVIIKQTPRLLKSCVRAMQPLSSGKFLSVFQRHNLQVSNITNVYYPYIVNNKADISYGDGNINAPYIFSKEFYAGISGQSPFELQITKLIKKEAISYIALQDFIDNLDNISDINRFYHIPFLLILLQVAR